MIGVVKRHVVAILWQVQVGGTLLEANLDRKFIGKYRTECVKVGDTVELKYLSPCFTKPFIVRRLPDFQGSSGLPYLHLAAGNQAMNHYEKAIHYYGLNSDSQGDAGWLHALFVSVASDYETTTGNPARGIYADLRQRGVNGHVLVKVQAFLNSYEVAFDAGRAA